MKNIYAPILIVILSVTGQFVCAQDIKWGNDLKITTGGGGTGIRPRILALDEDHGIIIWGNSSQQSIQYKYWSKDSLSQTRNIDMKNTKAFITDWASTELAGRNQYVYIVYKEDPADLGKIYLLRSVDYGKTFSTQIVVVDNTGFFSRFPGVAIDKDNQPIISYMRFKTDWTQAHYVTLRSSDFGNTFSPYVEATDISKGTACDCCPVGMASDGDRVAILYRNNRNNFRNMTAAISLDNAGSFAYTQELDTANWFLQSCPASGGDGFFNDHYLHTTWMSGRTGTNKVFYSRLDLNTQKVDAFQIMNHSLGKNLQQVDPKMAGNKDTVGICWTEAVTGYDIFFSYFTGNNSQDLIKNTVRINTDQNGSQDTPDLTYINGKFYLCWHDGNDNTIRFKIGVVNRVTRNENSSINADLKIHNLSDGIELNSDQVLDEWQIYNLQGIQIAKGYNTQNATIPIPFNGLYFIRYKWNGGIHLTKFIY